jgi:hypothetical protein
MSKRDVPQLVTRWNILESAGVPLEPPDCRVGIDTEKRGTGLTVRAGRDRWRSKIRELRDGRFGFIIAIFIRRDDPGKTIILDAWIGTSWPDTSIDLLEDPAFEEKHPGYYNLPGDSERFFREEVVNNRIINNTLARGGIRAGLLLAVGSRPPDNCKDRDEIPIAFTVQDQWYLEHPVTLQARMIRRPARAKASLASRCDRARPRVRRPARVLGGELRERGDGLPLVTRGYCSLPIQNVTQECRSHLRCTGTNFSEEMRTGAGRFRDSRSRTDAPKYGIDGFTDALFDARRTEVVRFLVTSGYTLSSQPRLRGVFVDRMQFELLKPGPKGERFPCAESAAPSDWTRK